MSESSQETASLWPANMMADVAVVAVTHVLNGREVPETYCHFMRHMERFEIPPADGSNAFRYATASSSSWHLLYEGADGLMHYATGRDCTLVYINPQHVRYYLYTADYTGPRGE